MRNKEFAMMIIQWLVRCGYKAFLVGGAVRNELHNKYNNDNIPIKDYDVTTNARYDEVISIFTEMGYFVETRGEHFSVAVVCDTMFGDTVEVASFRGESYPEGGSLRPNEVHHVKTFREDSMRRDFTVNSIGVNFVGDVVDYHGGVEDIKRHVIRTVGDPAKRFGEDPLRMLRAVRFATQLGYVIDDSTGNAIQENIHLLEMIPHTRVADEVNKILVSKNPLYGIRLLNDLGIIGCKFHNKTQHRLVKLLPYMKNSPFLYLDMHGDDLPAAWFRLFHICNISDGEAREMLVDLMPLNLNDIKLVELMIRYVKQLVLDDVNSGNYRMILLGLARDAKRYDVFKRVIEKFSVIFNGLDRFFDIRFCYRTRPYFREQLPINGEELMEIANKPPGPWIRDIQDALLIYIIQLEVYDEDKVRRMAVKLINEDK